MALYNDERSSAAVLGVSQQQSTIGATDGDVWFKFKAPNSGELVLRTLGSNFDTTLVIYDEAGESIGYDDDGGVYRDSVLRVYVEVGKVYFVQQRGYYGDVGNLVLTSSIASAPFETISTGPRDNGSGSGGQYVPGAFYGTEGADLILTRDAPGTFVGNGGNDTYLVNGNADTVIEAAGGGTDIVYTTSSFTLGAAEVEAISTVQQTDTTAINLIGNYVSQTIVGNYGNNVLNGGGGQDTLIGLFGDDTYAVGDSRTVIQEQVGQGNDTLVTSVDYRLGAGVSIETFAAQDASSTTGLRLTGNELGQTIAGTAGADTIGGGGGRDVLIGGAGADTFVIGTVAAGNVAVLADFVSGTDRIGLTSTAFNVGTSLDAAEFVAGTAATTAAQRVIYDAGTGQLFYDADGNGSGAAVLFAQVVPGTAITAASFDVIVPTATAG